MNNNEVLLNTFYKLMWCEFSNMDALYEDYIIDMIGRLGLNTLVSAGRLESCGEINGRKLYSLDKRYI